MLSKTLTVQTHRVLRDFKGIESFLSPKQLPSCSDSWWCSLLLPSNPKHHWQCTAMGRCLQWGPTLGLILILPPAMWPGLNYYPFECYCIHLSMRVMDLSWKNTFVSSLWCPYNTSSTCTWQSDSFCFLFSSTAVILSWDLYVSDVIGCTPASVFTADV